MPDPFDIDAHRIRGNARDAADWVRQSSLADDQKDLLLRFIARFPSLSYFKDDAALLDHIEQRDQLTLPGWFREQRQVLAFVTPPALVRVDDFDHLSPRSDTLDGIWYAIELDGYRDDEQRELFLDQATSYPIGYWPHTDRSFLAINTADHDDQRIYEFAAQDLLDNVLDGGAARDSVYPAFDSYARMLSHIIEVKDVSGQVTAAASP